MFILSCEDKVQFYFCQGGRKVERLCKLVEPTNNQSDITKIKLHFILYTFKSHVHHLRNLNITHNRVGNGNPLQCSCLDSSMDGGTWGATYSSCGCRKLDTTEHNITHNDLNIS